MRDFAMRDFAMRYFTMGLKPELPNNWDWPDQNCEENPGRRKINAGARSHDIPYLPRFNAQK
jgi:hypothetical protein